jgi:hypothetical protein
MAFRRVGMLHGVYAGEVIKLVAEVAVGVVGQEV